MRFSVSATAPFSADELFAIWNTASARHVAFGGCACGVDGVVLKLDDFEADIVEYLLDEARRYDRADVVDFLETSARRTDLGWSVAAMLGALTVADVIEVSARTFLLVRLGRTLGSFAETHGTSRRFEAN